MGRIADQHHVAVVPTLAMHAIEVEPGRAAQMVGVALQRVAVEITREQPLAESDGARSVEPVETMGQPGLLARLDDDRGEVAAELVGVDLEPAVLGALEGEGERLECLGGTEPDVAALAPVELRLEHGLVSQPGLAVGAVGRDDEVRVLESGLGVDLVLEALPDSELRCALLQDPEQALAADAAEPVAAADEALAGKMDVDVVPMMEVAYDGGVRGRIGGAKVLHRLVGEDHAPAEGIVRPIALVDLDGGVRQGLAQQDGGVQARGAAAQADDSLHGGRPPMLVSLASRLCYIARYLRCQVSCLVDALGTLGDSDHDKIVWNNFGRR